ncbi:MAG TPA: hypothetical protein VFB69_08020 [Candidatus Dormibacteraeota bacterium]|nr:hypothetical protein [Candidatus Dormibacteraeota bacterium]
MSISAVLFRRPVVLVAYTLLAIAMFANVWSAPASHWIGVDGDPDSTIWSIAWSAYSLTHLLNPFLTNWVFYPSGTDVLWANADAPIALGWAATPVTLLFGPIVAYNVLQTLCLSLSAFVAYLAFARLVTRPATAFAGGLVYGFGPYMLGQAYGHMGLNFGVLPPLIFILVHGLLVRRDIAPWLAGAVAGFALAFQFLVSLEVAATVVIVTAVAVAWLAVTAFVLARRAVAWRALTIRALYAAAVAVPVFLVLAGYPLYLIFRGPVRITHTPVRAFGFYATDIYNVLIPVGTTHLVRNGWTETISKNFPGSPVESGGYLGVVLVLVLLYTALRWARVPAVLFAAGAGALTFLITLGPHLVHDGHFSTHVPLPWLLANNVPVLDDILVDRMSLYVDLFAGLMLALFLDLSWELPGVRWRAGAAVAAALSLLMLAPALPWASSTAHVPDLFQPGTLANRELHAAAPDGSVAVILPAQLMQKDHGYSMLWQATDGMRFKMPVGDLVHGDSRGYATSDPAPSALWTAIKALTNDQAPPATPADLAAARADLADWGVRAVVAGPMPDLDLVEQYFDALLGHPPVRTGGVLLWTLASP